MSACKIELYSSNGACNLLRRRTLWDALLSQSLQIAQSLSSVDSGSRQQVVSSRIAAARQTGRGSSLTQVPDLTRDVRQSKLESRKLAKRCNALLRLSFPTTLKQLIEVCWVRRGSFGCQCLLVLILILILIVVVVGILS